MMCFTCQAQRYTFHIGVSHLLYVKPYGVGIVIICIFTTNEAKIPGSPAYKWMSRDLNPGPAGCRVCVHP